MKPSLIIPRLRAQCSSFSNRIAGAAELLAAVESKWDVGYPAAFVVPASPRVADSVSAPGVVQLVDDVFGVVVIVDNTAGQDGAAAAETLAVLQAELLAALLAWRPSATYQPVRFVDMDLVDIDRARIVAQYDFASRYLVQGA